jgi:DNA-directed RNA polymerase specialized sigma24 family protein
MKVDTEPINIVPVAACEAANYAAPTEVEKAMQALTVEDYAKLMLIARSHCKGRKFTPSVLEPGELLGEAFKATLKPRGKRWNKRVSFVKHLDRAMENISGHMVEDRQHIVPFPEGLEPSPEQAGEPELDSGPDEVLMGKQEMDSLLFSIFGDDKEAANIFVLRAEGFQASEIQNALCLSTTNYEAIARRIRRKVSAFLISPK